MKDEMSLVYVFNRWIETHRYALRLPKTHYVDAAIIASRDQPLQFKQTKILFKKRVVEGDYQQTTGKRSEKQIPTGKLWGLRKFDQVQYGEGEYFIKGRMASGYAILMDIHGNKVEVGHTPKLRGMKRGRARKSWLLAEEPLPLEGTLGVVNNENAGTPINLPRERGNLLGGNDKTRVYRHLKMIHF